MNKLLIIGATGLLGSKAMEMGKDSYEVYGTYNKNARSGLSRLYVTKKKEVKDLINKIQPDTVLDAHSITNLEYCERNPILAWNVNIGGSLNIAEASKKVGARYIFISTDFVFDGKQDMYSEEDATNPLNVYGRTKRTAERLITHLDMDSTIIRTANLYGQAGSTGKRSFMPWVVESLRNKERIQVISDIFNSPTFNEDVVSIIFKLDENDSNGIFHVVGRDNISKYDFAVQIANVFGLDANLIEPVKASELPSTLIRPNRIKLSTEKVERATSIKPMGINEALQRIRL